MKTKSFLLGAAALMLAASCSNDEVVNVAPQSGAIGFSSFVNNSTRADYGTGDGYAELTKLNVYGVREHAGLNGVNEALFNGVLVTKGDPVWTYEGLRYWVPGSKYTFAAVAPHDVIIAEGTPNAGEVVVNYSAENMTYGGVSTIDFNNNGDVDLLFDSPENIDLGTLSSHDPVELSLGHLLSRVRFAFTNGLTDNLTIQVSDVKITDAAVEGIYSTSTQAWTASTYANEEGINNPFAFSTSGNPTEITDKEITGSQNLIPEVGKKEYTATFKLDVVQKSTNTQVGKTLNFTVTLPEMEYEPGLSYTFSATIDKTNITKPDNPDDAPKPIQFTANVDPWGAWTEKGDVTFKKSENSAE